MRTGGQSDMTKLMIAFRNFSKAPKIRAVNNSSHMQFLCRMASDACFYHSCFLSVVFQFAVWKVGRIPEGLSLATHVRVLYVMLVCMPTARDHIKENEMGGSYSTHVRGKKCKTDLV